MQKSEIAKLRHALGMTQEQLAAEVGVSRVAVTLWENGKRSPSGPAEKILEQLKAKLAKKLSRNQAATS